MLGQRFGSTTINVGVVIRLATGTHDSEGFWSVPKASWKQSVCLRSLARSRRSGPCGANSSKRISSRGCLLFDRLQVPLAATRHFQHHIVILVQSDSMGAAAVGAAHLL